VQAYIQALQKVLTEKKTYSVIMRYEMTEQERCSPVGSDPFRTLSCTDALFHRSNMLQLQSGYPHYVTLTTVGLLGCPALIKFELTFLNVIICPWTSRDSRSSGW